MSPKQLYHLPNGIRVSTVKFTQVSPASKTINCIPAKQTAMPQKIGKLTRSGTIASANIFKIPNIPPKPKAPPKRENLLDCNKCLDKYCDGQKHEPGAENDFPIPTCNKCSSKMPMLYNFCLRIDAFERKFLCIKCSEKEERRYLFESETEKTCEDETDQIQETNSKITKLQIRMAGDCKEQNNNSSDDENENTFACSWCMDVFCSDEKLDSHIERVHKTKRKIACRVCGILFKTFDDRQHHERRKHRCPETGRYKCLECPKILKSIETIGSHILTCHKDNQRTSTCDLCGKSFKAAGNLSNHMRSHQGDRSKYVCKLCGKGFLFNHALKKHIILHTDVRPFACNKCDKSYKDLTDLRRHKFSHGGYEKTFKCVVCPKAFFEAKSLRYHVKSHNIGDVETPANDTKCN